MIEVNWISWSDKQHYQEIIYNTCELASAHIKKTKTKTAHGSKKEVSLLSSKTEHHMIWITRFGEKKLN